MRYFIYFVIGVVAASIVAGFFIVDSPAETRLRKFDEQRINDLSFIQSEIINYWMKKERLPENLDVLIDNLRGIIIPKDPQTNERYVYEIKNSKNLMFSLCAIFSKDNSYTPFQSGPKIPRPVYPLYADPGYQSWKHGIGYVCFERTIDPELYKSKVN
jgi:hypothetical protein